MRPNTSTILAACSLLASLAVPALAQSGNPAAAPAAPDSANDPVRILVSRLELERICHAINMAQGRSSEAW